MNISNLKNFIICPNCEKANFDQKENNLLCVNCNEKYPIILDIPILITKKNCEKKNLQYHEKGVEKKILGTNKFEKNKYGIINYIKEVLIGTSGILYKNIYEPKEYPIANIPFPLLRDSEKKTLLDIACGWGRWTIDAAKKGYSAIGVDKDLEGLLAAKIISKELNLHSCEFICCDALKLPLKNEAFDNVFSYSFLQHFSENNLKIISKNISSKMSSNSIFKTQMINKYSLRGAYNQFKIKYFKNNMIKKGRIGKSDDEKSFNVRYFSIKKINNIFNQIFTIKSYKNYSFFTQAQITDLKLFKIKSKFFVITSYFANVLAKIFPILKFFTDNLIYTLIKRK